MNMEQIREKNRGIENKIGWKARQELIRSIQERQGGIPCFQTGKEYCDLYDCSWRVDCIPASK